MAAKQYGRWGDFKTVAEGGQAFVYTTTDTTGKIPGRHVLKRLKNPERSDRFKREVDATRKLNHPNILRVVDFDLEHKPPYYVSEWCQKGSLEDIGAAQFRGNITRTLDVLLPIVDALQAAADAHVVHRDIKPANILLREDGTPVLADFGICHFADGQLFTLSDRGMGSQNYIAPEMQAGQQGMVTHAVDVYALGKVLYWMLSGGHIFARENHRAEGVYLVERLGDQRWEHVHIFLDTMLREDYRRRVSDAPLALLHTILPDMADMVVNDFTPLRPSMGLRCQWCGRGRYIKVARLTGDNVDWIGPGLRALKCNVCGRLELFQISQEQLDWFNR